MTKPALLTSDSDGRARCWWCGTDEQYMAYHDEEWGRPVTDDRHLFEKLSLEAFQSGLSWLTILRKRDNFRKAFKKFNINTVARFNESDVERLLQDAGIVRHRGKIEAVINNAQRAKELIKSEGSLAAYVWSYEPKPRRTHVKTMADIPTTCDEATAMAKDLKKRGWKFVGPTTVYAFMQSMGLVNDHVRGCHSRDVHEAERTALVRPT